MNFRMLMVVFGDGAWLWAVWKRWIQKWAGRELTTRWMVWRGVGVAMMWDRKAVTWSWMVLDLVIWIVQWK